MRPQLQGFNGWSVSSPRAQALDLVHGVIRANDHEGTSEKALIWRTARSIDVRHADVQANDIGMLVFHGPARALRRRPYLHLTPFPGEAEPDRRVNRFIVETSTRSPPFPPKSADRPGDDHVNVLPSRAHLDLDPPTMAWAMASAVGGQPTRRVAGSVGPTHEKAEQATLGIAAMPGKRRGPRCGPRLAATGLRRWHPRQKRPRRYEVQDGLLRPDDRRIPSGAGSVMSLDGTPLVPATARSRRAVVIHRHRIETGS